MFRMTKRASRRGLRPYTTGLLCVLLAYVLTQVAWFPAERRLPTLFSIAVLMTAWYGGLLPGLMTTILGLIGYLLVMPSARDVITQRGEILVGYLVFCMLLSALSGLRLRSQLRFQGEHERLLV